MEDMFKKLREDLAETLKKSLATTNYGIKDLRAWVGWIVGTFCMRIMFKLVFYDSYMEEKLGKRHVEMEMRPPLIENAMSQLKLELKLEHQERILLDINKKL